MFAAFLNTHLSGLIFNLFDNFSPALKLNNTGFPVNHGPDIPVITIFGTTSFLDCLFHRGNHFFSVDGFFTCNNISDLNQFQTGN